MRFSETFTYAGSIIALFLLSTFSCPLYAQTADSVDKVVVYKSKRILKLLAGAKVVKEYPISLGQNPKGHKQQQGDSRTPEGQYTIDYRNPNSRFYLSLHITYPNSRDRARARKKGVNPGGDIFIHGLPGGSTTRAAFYAQVDWTDGCIAVSNEAMRDIWKRVRNGTIILIQP